MFPVPTILHPTDFSDPASSALHLARTLARDLQARLLLLYVAPKEYLHAGAMLLPVDAQVYREALDALKRPTDGPDLKYPIETELRHGDPATEILRSAADSKCRMMIMGSHGRSGLARVLLGSVAEQVMRKAPCPVLTVKTPACVLSDAASELEAGKL